EGTKFPLPLGEGRGEGVPLPLPLGEGWGEGAPAAGNRSAAARVHWLDSPSLPWGGCPLVSYTGRCQNGAGRGRARRAPAARERGETTDGPGLSAVRAVADDELRARNPRRAGGAR